jgi:hypothetical protein
MDRQAIREAARLLASLIGEIMEDHVELALTAGEAGPTDWPEHLQRAGADIADLAKAIAVLCRRAESAD